MDAFLVVESFLVVSGSLIVVDGGIGGLGGHVSSAGMSSDVIISISCVHHQGVSNGTVRSVLHIRIRSISGQKSGQISGHDRRNFFSSRKKLIRPTAMADGHG